MPAAACTTDSSICRLPVTGPQRRVMASRASSKEPRAASITASFARVRECRPAGRDRAASAGCQFGAPGFRKAHRVIVTVPNKGGQRPAAPGFQPRPGDPVRSGHRGGARAGLLLFPHAPQVVVVLQQA